MYIRKRLSPISFFYFCFLPFLVPPFIICNEFLCASLYGIFLCWWRWFFGHVWGLVLSLVFGVRILEQGFENAIGRFILLHPIFV